MPIPITARGAKMLKDELQRLKTQDRPAVVQAIAEAREKGDLSENAEYDAARESQAFIEGRILELEFRLWATMKATLNSVVFPWLARWLVP